MDFDAQSAFPESGDGPLVVGVGASAGGIQALKRFFAAVPREAGIGYVVILHISPDHASNLAEVLQAVSTIPVKQVRVRERIEPDHAYVVPPRGRLSVMDGHIEVSPMETVEQRRAPFDMFLRSLAEGHHDRAVSVILSGTGADGSLGLKCIKECGGLAIVQEPGDAEFADMPRNAIATSLVDYVLPAAEIPGRIAQYARHMATVVAPRRGRLGERDQALTDIFSHMRTRVGHDFAGYKRSTVMRRIERRLGVNGLETYDEYLELLRASKDEARALLKDLLISVTSFFRDPQAFAALDRLVIPAILEHKRRDEQVRIWVPGCATGEEAYSLAMLVAKRFPSFVEAPTIQVFATDIDEQALAKGRAGAYNSADVADVPAELLARFFVREGDGFRVRREIREMVLFAAHNVIRDPPFSHLDLVSCRNLLIYFDRAAQERALRRLHFALTPNGFLFLGSSESADEGSNLFVAADRDAHIFRSRGVAAGMPLAVGWTAPAIARSPGAELPEEHARLARVRERISFLELHQRLLEQYAPPSLVVNRELDIVHLSDRAGAFLQFSGGEPSQNLLKVVRPELRPELHGAISQAVHNRVRTEAMAGPLQHGGASGSVRIVVSPVLDEHDPARGMILVTFEPARGEVPEGQETAGAEGAVGEERPLARHLEQELARVKLQLRTTIEQYELQQEELKASNEELLAMNEELRSSSEELETSTEELQSVNEELSTLNQELKIKIEELSQAHSDTRNLMNSTDMATLFVDPSMCVKLFTARARTLFNLIPEDAGRPLRDITHKLRHDTLFEDIERVRESLGVVEREVQAADGRWYLMRVLPYRTAEDRIAGVVLTFTDFTERKHAEQQLRESEERIRLMVESVPDFAIFTLDTDGIINSWNVGARQTFGYTEEEAIGKPGAIIFIPEDRATGEPEKEMKQARELGRAIDERWHLRKDGSRLYVSGVMAPLLRERKLVGYTKVARDLTKRQAMEQELRDTRERLESRVQERTRELKSEMAERAQSDEDRVRLLRRLVTAQEEERGRISRELHDQLGQEVTALSLKLAALRDTPEIPASLRVEIQKAESLVRELDDDVEFLVWQLRPTALNELGLAEAMSDYLTSWSEHFEVKAMLRSTLKRRLPAEIETVLYRIAQESLNNVAKHAGASRVQVSLELADDFAVMRVEDDGVGFDPEAPRDTRAMGLVGMRERAALVGGLVIVDSSPGKGTRITVRIPS